MRSALAGGSCPHETGANRFFRNDVEARHAGFNAEAKAQRQYANYVNALPVPVRTRGQEISDAFEAAKTHALSEGVTPEAWKSLGDVRAAPLPDMRDGAELVPEYRRKRS